MWPWRRRPKSEVPPGTPGPSPWALMTDHAARPAGFTWTKAGSSSDSAGVAVLSAPAGPVLLLEFHNYVSILDGEKLLIWHQASYGGGHTPPVFIRGFEYSGARTLQGPMEALSREMRSRKLSHLSAEPPFFEVGVPTSAVDHWEDFTFPEQLRGIEELLILCYSSAIDHDPGGDRNNVALMVARPREGRYRLYPQDWFNGGGYDYSFQGISRVARDPNSGRVYGDGIRIAPFVLGKSLRRRA
jgi:hypothetical protein